MTTTSADRLRRATARFEKSKDAVRGIARADLLETLHLASMAEEYLNRLIERVENQAGMADDEAEILVLSLDAALEVRTLLRAVRGAFERMEERIGNPWTVPPSNLRGVHA